MGNHTQSGESGTFIQQIFGYPIVRELGQGAASRIYLAKDPTSHHPLAIKHVLRRREHDIRSIQQMQTEHEISQKIRHPRIRRCLELHIKRALLTRRPTEALLVMEYFEGHSMDRLHFRKMRCLLGCAIHVGEALYAMHQSGVVHCDLKPQNILINDSNEVRVIDLGQACTVGTVKERIQGTPDFIAPEQVRCWPMTVPTDIFNFGATLYWCLTRQKLPTLFNIERKAGCFLMDDRFPKPHELNPMVPEALSKLVIECVRTAPSKRPQDMTEVLRRLETIRYSLTARAPVQEPPPPTPSAPAREVVPHPARALREWVPTADWDPHNGHSAPSLPPATARPDRPPAPTTAAPSR